LLKQAGFSAYCAKNQQGLEIVLRTVKELLEGKIEDDHQHHLPAEPR